MIFLFEENVIFHSQDTYTCVFGESTSRSVMPSEPLMQVLKSSYTLNVFLRRYVLCQIFSACF